jgi:hypothetical protein
MISNDFATESIMLDHGFTSRLLAGLVSTGLAMLCRAPLRRQEKGSSHLHDDYRLRPEGARRMTRNA